MSHQISVRLYHYTDNDDLHKDPQAVPLGPAERVLLRTGFIMTIVVVSKRCETLWISAG